MRQLLLPLLGLFLLAVQARPQTQPIRPAEQRFTPRLEPVAETRLLMEGLAASNFRGLEGHLKQRPESLDAWVFARGQALLLAETGNLLLLRPPKTQGQLTWQQQATDLRDAATILARTLARRDYEGSRAALTSVSNTCNRCHQSFRVSVRVAPFAPPREE